MSIAGQIGIETYVLPGNHKLFEAYDQVINAFTNQFPNIHDTIKERKLVADSHHLVFLPGAEETTNAKYRLTTTEETGYYVLISTGMIPFEGWDQHRVLFSANLQQGFVHYENINDLEELVTEPEKTIVVCHVPRRFEGENAVDHAYLAKQRNGYTVPGTVLEQQLRRRVGDVSDEEIVAAERNGFELVRENLGSEELKEIYNKLGITKAVSAHFHESGGHANDLEGEIVAEGVYTGELFWNSGHFDTGQLGILEVSDQGLVRYQNLRNQY